MKAVLLVLLCLVAACEEPFEDYVPEDVDAEPCPEYPDGGTVMLTRRGCPLTIPYQIK